MFLLKKKYGDRIKLKMIIDTHAHLNFNAFREDLNQIIKKSLDNNIWIINVGSQYSTSKRAAEIAGNYQEGVYAAIGLHPIHLETGLVKIRADAEEIQLRTSRFKPVASLPVIAKQLNAPCNYSAIKQTKEEEFDYEKYKELTKSSKVVAIGEVGLDYYWKPKTKKRLELFKQKQKEAVLEQLKLAKELNLPVIFHCRMAHRDLIQFLKENNEMRPPTAVAHGFVGNTDELKE